MRTLIAISALSIVLFVSEYCHAGASEAEISAGKAINKLLKEKLTSKFKEAANEVKGVLVAHLGSSLKHAHNRMNPKERKKHMAKVHGKKGTKGVHHVSKNPANPHNITSSYSPTGDTPQISTSSDPSQISAGNISQIATSNDSQTFSSNISQTITNDSSPPVDQSSTSNFTQTPTDGESQPSDCAQVVSNCKLSPVGDASNSSELSSGSKDSDSTLTEPHGDETEPRTCKHECRKRILGHRNKCLACKSHHVRIEKQGASIHQNKGDRLRKNSGGLGQTPNGQQGGAYGMPSPGSPIPGPQGPAGPPGPMAVARPAAAPGQCGGQCPSTCAPTCDNTCCQMAIQNDCPMPCFTSCFSYCPPACCNHKKDKVATKEIDEIENDDNDDDDDDTAKDD